MQASSGRPARVAGVWPLFSQGNRDSIIRQAVSYPTSCSKYLFSVVILYSLLIKTADKALDTELSQICQLIKYA